MTIENTTNCLLLNKINRKNQIRFVRKRFFNYFLFQGTFVDDGEHHNLWGRRNDEGDARSYRVIIFFSVFVLKIEITFYFQFN
jgi:hypothetical protein